MRRSTLRNSLLVLLLLSTVLACKTKKVIVKTPDTAVVPVANRKKAENLVLLKGKDIPFNTLAMKGKVNLDMNGNVNNVNITIRIQKDQKIWASVTAIAGIEVARALITPDSVLLRNNLQSLAVKKPFSYLNSFTNKQVTFKMLQAILTGNTIAEFTNDQAELNSSGGVFTASGTQGELAFRVLFNTLLKTGELNMNEVRAAKALKVVYSDYQQVTDALFPSVIKINSVSGAKKTNLAFDFSKIERNVQLDYPFTLPKRFEIIN
ncbi:DUF4292 domain-containing protein [Pedobacter cryoconitis]|uniref:Uncharacterized protein DUF4292 n=1 Tax=Pedobacter cryoconitis TaxID=188932 RepID=A0A327SVR2_9SPHI|nr:DUF4292 domain-containing protein [Pedobacter cryoconitis]RAJ33420.1 uncharacterized protein DUF4292 [Pedobacter cryoconitis]